jgi:hypothetical protein
MMEDVARTLNAAVEEKEKANPNPQLWRHSTIQEL